jgi:alcohol dehydrogenase (quinone), cytochrome c subunit
MERSARIGIGAAGLITAGIAAAYLVSVAFGGLGGDRRARAPADRMLIDKGAYVAILGDCAACHTRRRGRPFAGGVPIPTPVGAIFSTNITPDRHTGIASYTYGDFERAVRRGIAPRGDTFYPAMPYPSYARMSDDDTRALYAYFLDGVKPVHAAAKSPAIVWPLSMRWPLAYWRWAFAPPVKSGTAGTSALARGAYLVEGPGHCGACHTPRGTAMEEVALTKEDGPRYLSGAVVDGFAAVDLRGDPRTGLGSWSESDIVRFLRTGHTANAAVFGGMSDVIRDSTQFETDPDLHAIARFLKSLPPTRGEKAFVYDPGTAEKLDASDLSAPGAHDYMTNCSNCHLSSGQGFGDEANPPLAGNPVVVTDDPVSVINLILNGTRFPVTVEAPTILSMPGFANRLSDEQVAALATFIRSAWGNRARAVTAGDVARIRKATRAPPGP